MADIGVVKKMEMCGNRCKIYLAYRSGNFHHNATCLYNTTEIGMTAIQHKHARLLRLNSKCPIVPFNHYL